MLLVRDRDLLQRFRAGEREAMAAVYEHYAASLARYLYSGFSFNSEGRQLRFEGLRQRYELHDVVAETFRRAFEERARLAYDGLKPFEGYLRAIARNLVIDRLRARRTSASGLSWDDVEQLAHVSEPTTVSPEQEAQRSELRQLLGEFLDGLSAKERRFVELRYHQALPQEEVARILRVTRRWVRSAEEKARRGLVRRLRGSGYLPSATGGARRKRGDHGM